MSSLSLCRPQTKSKPCFESQGWWSPGPGCSSVFWSPFFSTVAWAHGSLLPVCLQEDSPCLCGGLGQLKIHFPISPAPEAMGWVSLESAFELCRFTVQVLRANKNLQSFSLEVMKLKFTDVAAILLSWVSWTTGGVTSSVKPKCVIPT